MRTRPLFFRGTVTPLSGFFLLCLLLTIGNCSLGGFNSKKLEGIYEAEIVLAKPESGEAGMGWLAQGLTNLALKTANIEFTFYPGNTATIYTNLGVFELIGAFSAKPGAKAADFKYKITRDQKMLVRPEGEAAYLDFARIETYSQDYQYVRLALTGEKDEPTVYIDLKKTN